MVMGVCALHVAHAFHMEGQVHGAAIHLQGHCNMSLCCFLVDGLCVGAGFGPIRVKNGIVVWVINLHTQGLVSHGSHGCHED